MNQITVDPKKCPLCGKVNKCERAECVTAENCWCSNPAIVFSKELLDKVPPEAVRKACICRECVEKSMAS